MEKRTSKRRWLQFSVRTFLIAITLFAIWLGFWADRVRRQQAAVEAILAARGMVRFDYEVDSRANEPAAPEWLRGIFGEAYFRRVVEVEMGSDLTPLEDLPYLRVLVIGGPRVTNDDLVHLQGLRNLEELTLFNCYGITDDGMRHLANLRSLRRLDLTDTKATDAWLLHLKGLRKLELLNLQGDACTARGIRALLASLPNLNVPIIKFRPRAESEQETVDKLAKAGASFTVGDSGEVTGVVLRGKDVTDEIVPLLTELSALNNVLFLGTLVSNQAVESLRARRPQLKVDAPYIFKTLPEEAAIVAKLRLLGALMKPNGDGHVQLVSLTESPIVVEDAHLQLIGGLSQLECLETGATQVSGVGLKHLAGCSRLSSLHLQSSRLTDADLLHLQNFPQLKSLEFRDAQIRGSGLVHLARLDKLEDLGLSGNPVEDQYLKHLTALPSLQGVSLRETPITNAGMKHLAACSGLKSISLVRTKVTDQGVALLLELEHLEQLDVHQTDVSDAMKQKAPQRPLPFGRRAVRRPPKQTKQAN